MRINPFVYAFLVLAVFLGVIYGFRAAGIWSVTGRQDSQGRDVQPDAADPGSIKGWMTLEQISAAYDVSLEEIIQEFNLPAGTSPDTAVKDLESDLFSVERLREWLASRSAAPAIAPTQPTPTPAPTPLPSPTPQTAAEQEHSPEDRQVSGQTTFQDLLDWGLSQEVIEQIIGGPMPDASTRIRDHLSGTGVRFSEIKAKLQAELDKLAQP